MTEYKACSRCKQILPYEAFCVKSSSISGRASACKSCTSSLRSNVSQERRDLRNYRKRQWALNNPDKIKIINRNSYERSPEQFINNSAKRYAKIKNVDRRTITNKELKRLHRQPCLYCSSTKLIEIDHIIPIARGGRHAIGNLAPACRACNRNKTDYLVMEWKLKRQGR